METQRSVYRRGAENGLVMGPLMAVVVILMGATGYVSLLGVPAIFGLMAVPCVAYIMLARSYREDDGRSTFSALWLQGICAFFFGGMLMAVAVFVALRWVWPGFITEQMRMMGELLAQQSGAEAEQLARVFRKSVESGNVPSPIDIALELIYVVVFTGSLLSMLLSLIIRSRRRTTPPKFDNK